MKRVYDPVLFNAEAESIDKDKYIIATYYTENEAPDGIVDHLSLIQEMNLTGSTGTWTSVPDDNVKLREMFTPKILGYYPIPTESEHHKKAMVQLGIHIESFPPNFPMLLISIAGNTLFFPGNNKLVGVSFPESFTKSFPGPKFGIEGVREILGVEERPLLLCIIKPKMGMSPEETAEQAYKAAIGGADMIKDDEMCSETFNCLFEDRIKAVVAALDKAEQETGQKTIYFVSITDEVTKMHEKAKRAVELGATGILIGYSVGLSAVKEIAEDPEINVPILLHPTTVASQAPILRYPVVAKLGRLAGADLMLNGTRWATLPFASLEDCMRTNMIAQAPMFNIKTMFNAPSGGMHPGFVKALIEENGPDIFLPAGGGVSGHPGGTTAGCIAMRQAIDAGMAGIELEEAAKDPKNKELKQAIELWGVLQRPKTKWFKTNKDWSGVETSTYGFDYSK